MTLYALLGSKALYLLYVWLISTAAAAYLSDRKGYGERPGLASGLFLFVLGPIIWLLVPARADSKWVTAGIWGSRTKEDRALDASEGRDV
jgi:hypothetical protein